MMRSRNSSVGIAAVAIVVLAVLGTATRAGAEQEKVLHNFGQSTNDGLQPYGGVILDTAGNIYGTTLQGGGHNCGTVFELTPTPGGTWTERVLHFFTGNGKDGCEPTANLTFDSAGNLFGTTYYGGAYGYGTVFELTATSASWVEKPLHDFGNNSRDGRAPYGGLIFDAAGNLYGTTILGGVYGGGTVFELLPQSSGGWAEKILYTFDPSAGDALYPSTSLIFDAAGNLYGTAEGGASSYGEVFELTPTADGKWNKKVLHTFNKNGVDGYEPAASLSFDVIGNLYGTTAYGGSYNLGTVFELMPTAAGGWTESILYSFNGKDGQYLETNLLFDGAGHLYGAALQGDAYANLGGVIFQLTPTAGGHWMETPLHDFGNGMDGQEPLGNLVFDGAGNLYGTTTAGGAYHEGTVFEVIP